MNDRGNGASSSLTPYRRKRDFRRTAEPEGAPLPADTEGLRFVVQKHAARGLHYDLRLELDGVLKSWAVPKGPSLDPDVRALAVHVEDHPLEYATFEGIIPAGEYGAGTVMVWDHGKWLPEGDAVREYEKGHLRFRLHGEKLNGRWLLVRMGNEENNWLLRKLDDDHARRSATRIVDAEPLSVASGRTLEEIAEEEKAEKAEPDPSPEATPIAPPNAPRAAPRRRLPERFLPQLPTLVREPPEGDRWLHEIKFDGYRLLARVEEGGVRLVTRRGHDWTERFPTVAAATEEMGIEGSILDGEVVVPRPDGTTDFQALQNIATRGSAAPLRFYVFDLPYYRGHDLTGLPLLDRKELLKRVMGGSSSPDLLRYSDHIRGHGPRVVERACREGLEGIVAKREDASYREGRTRSWVKIKCVNRREFVVGGWTDPAGARLGLGALLMGWYDEDGALRYAGKVGTGFTEETLSELRARLDRIPSPAPPFADPPRGRSAGSVHWVQPALVAEVQFGDRTEEGLLRHASFQGLREDKAPEEIGSEPPVSIAAVDDGGQAPASTRHRSSTRRKGGPTKNTVAGVRLSNPGRVLYPEEGITKRELAEYYEAVADHILPHIAGRPLTLVRCPRGHEGQCFYQKHMGEGMPDWIRSVAIEEKDGIAHYISVDGTEGLVSLVQLGVLEIHPWGSRTDRLDRPDRLIFDLDPGQGVGWDEVVDAARRMRRRLEDLGLDCFVRTTGGKGLHVVVPLVRRSTWSEVKGFARDVARGFERRDRSRFIASASKSARKGRIFIDYLRNDQGATAIASFSTRARAGAPVAVPLSWDELSGRRRPEHTIASVPRRLKRLRRNPWAGFFETRQTLTKRMRESAAR